MGMNRLRIVGLLSALALVTTSCGLFGDDEPTSSPTPSKPTRSPSTSTTGSGDFGQPAGTKPLHAAGRGGQSLEVAVSVYGVYSDGDHAVLQFGLRVTGGNGGGGKLYEYLQRDHPLPGADDDASTSDDASGLTLIDPKEKKAYLVAQDAKTGGDCLCAEEVAVVAGSTSVGTATFKAPPAGTKTIDVSMGQAGYFPDVPVTNGESPEVPTTASPQPGATTPAFLPLEPESDGPPARADVVDLDTPSANLDLSVTKRKDRVVLAGDVLFEFDKATLARKGKARLAEAAKILRKEADGKVMVNGYTDSKGSKSYNLDLSKRRAATVKKNLEPMLDGSGITLVPKGYGEADPVAPNTKNGKDNPGGRKLNRRVEIVFNK